MAAKKIRKGKLTPADLATFGILPKLPKAPKLAKVPKPDLLDRAATVSEIPPSPSESEAEDVRLRGEMERAKARAS